MAAENERISFHDQISRNKLKSIALIVAIFLVFLVLGYVISLATSPGSFFMIMILAIIFSTFYLIFTYYSSANIALFSVGAKPAPHEQYNQYFHIVDGLATASGLPMPKLYVMPGEQINAFASGRDPEHAVVCVTEGALRKLDKHELEGVIAHEMSHIANFDIRFMTLVAVMVGMVAIISEIFLRSLWFRSGNNNEKGGNAVFLVIGIILAILAPIATTLIQFAISRKREFAADASGVKFTRSPSGLISALKKIKDDKPMKVNKAMAPLFLSDPTRSKIANLFSTHPPLDERIKILSRM